MDEEIIKWIIGGNFSLNGFLLLTIFLLQKALKKKDKDLQASYKARINDAKTTSNILSKVNVREYESPQSSNGSESTRNPNETNR